MTQYRGINSPLSEDAEDFPAIDPDLAMALRLSVQDQKLMELEMQKEQELMEKVLKLSLEEK